jgi:hypothetical protein
MDSPHVDVEALHMAGRRVMQQAPKGQSEDEDHRIKAQQQCWCMHQQ